MNAFRLTCLCCFGLLVGLTAETLGFKHEIWTNSGGKKIEAQLIQVDGDDVTLKLKKTGKRYTLKKEKLSAESNGKIEKYRKEVETSIRKGNLDAGTLFKGAALGLNKKMAHALKDQKLSFTVTDVRISTSRTEAHLEFGDGVFYQVQARKGYEFFERRRNLYQRPVQKTRLDGRTNLNELSRLVAKEGAAFTIQFSSDPLLEGGTVGITDGVILHP